MREILFRGKCLFDGDFVEGLLFETKEHTYIAFTDQYDDDLFISPKNIFIEVNPETVGQYTGLTDKNGKRIFEGDILNGLLSLHPDRRIFQVGYEDNGFYFFDEDEDEVGWHPDHIVDYEVIGNIHDNPELMKGGE